VNDCTWRAPCKGGVFPVGERPIRLSLQPEAIGAVMEVTKWLIALGKRGRGGTMMRWRNLLLESSWCKSSPVKAVAGRPVASVAIRRVTGGCEAYTASKQAVRIQLRNL
jgi:hypothetical protein